MSRDEQRALVDGEARERSQRRLAIAQADHVADVLQVRVVAALQAAEHAVRIAQVHHQRGDGGGGAMHRGLGRLRAHAAAAHDAVVGLPVLLEARIVIRVHHRDILAQLHAQVRLA